MLLALEVQSREQIADDIILAIGLLSARTIVGGAINGEFAPTSRSAQCYSHPNALAPLHLLDWISIG